MKKATLSLALASVLLPCVAAGQVGPGSPYEAPGPERDSWYIGFGAGLGAGSLTVDGRTTSFHDFASKDQQVPLALQFELGATVQPDLLLGLDLRMVGVSGGGSAGDGIVDRDVNVVEALAVITWFPRQHGFFVRGGAGLAAIGSEATINGQRSKKSVTGVGGLLGLGYAWWLGRHFNLTLNTDLSGQVYDHDAGQPSSSRTLDVYLGFTWY